METLKKDNAHLKELRASAEYFSPEGVSELKRKIRKSQISFTVM